MRCTNSRVMFKNLIIAAVNTEPSEVGRLAMGIGCAGIIFLFFFFFFFLGSSFHICNLKLIKRV